ncbi:MAG: IPT/TIG domain-containing protein [Planctomycetes bacterium]|nr:IPT/TIG domain-containing protein [Planctomycetota bacterium]
MKAQTFLSIGLAAGILAGSVRAQIAVSSIYSLTGEEVLTVTVGASSPGAGGAAARAAHGALGSVAPGEGLSSTRKSASGFVSEFDLFGGSGPIVFGVNPAQGPTTGGTATQIQGARLSGVGIVQFGATAVAVGPSSPTRLVATSPPSLALIAAGAVDLTVTSVAGSTVVPKGYMYVPGVSSSDDMVPGGDVRVRYFGPAGSAFGYAMSLGSIPPLPFMGIAGFLQLDPLGLLFVRSSTFLGNGSREFLYPTPADPALAGATVYWQPVLLPPGTPEFGNLANTTFL